MSNVRYYRKYRKEGEQEHEVHVINRSPCQMSAITELTGG